MYQRQPPEHLRYLLKLLLLGRPEARSPIRVFRIASRQRNSSRDTLTEPLDTSAFVRGGAVFRWTIPLRNTSAGRSSALSLSKHAVGRPHPITSRPAASSAGRLRTKRDMEHHAKFIPNAGHRP
jgi:hypothetical protein